ncbi:SAM-dependent methyltransferase [Kangiella sp. TOML190]|uniref:SAM-dependent methyltransferase n=1 Tax=Kangiella sp. TOML190 TaxID=2931351 RepID=UPI002042563F|nr:SAM-dependent methyltransferase [Kangiella sp. TOML190]
MDSNRGSLTIVSTGMLIGGDISVRCQEIIKQADQVFSLMSSAVGDSWLDKLNPNHQSLQYLYGKTKHRMDSYEEMVEVMMQAVRQGKKVCGAFYGHAGVFAWAPHEAVRVARKEGFEANMLPGISADLALYADVGIDPATQGVQAFEATQLLFYKHNINPAGYVILWQIGLIGEYTARSFDFPEKGPAILVEHLSQWYPLDHSIILYECAVLPILETRIERMELKDLVNAELNLITTMVLEPYGELEANDEILNKFNISEALIAKR